MRCEYASEFGGRAGFGLSIRIERTRKLVAHPGSWLLHSGRDNTSWDESGNEDMENWGIISISRGKSKGRPEGAMRPTAGDEPREFTSRGEGGRVPPFFEKLQIGRAIVDLM